jgi:hypothetical protein
METRMEYSNRTSGHYTEDEMTYLRGEKRMAPRGSSLPSGMPLWVRKSLLLKAEMRASQTMPAEQATQRPSGPAVNDSDQLSRRLKLANL